MTRVLVLDETGIVIPDAAVEAIEALDGETDTPWLFELMRTARSSGSAERRALRLTSGLRVAVPASMRIDEVQVLELPALIRRQASKVGVVGIAELGDRLGLVCDPRLLPLQNKPPEEEQA